MKRIKLTQGKYAIVSDEDYEYLNQWKWCVLKCKRKNLRSATRSQNCMNKGKQKNNTSGYKGVCWDNNAKKWRAYIKINGKRKHLGLFEDIEEAVKTYKEAARKYHEEFARIN